MVFALGPVSILFFCWKRVSTAVSQLLREAEESSLAAPGAGEHIIGADNGYSSADIAPLGGDTFTSHSLPWFALNCF
jgi:hypothetical protein